VTPFAMSFYAHKILAAWLFAFAAELVPPTSHSYLGETLDETEQRYESYSDDVADVALDPEEEPLQGLDRIRSAAVLIVVTARESAFRRDVMACERPGMGHAWGPLQFQGPKALVCRSQRQAIRWGYAMLRESFARCAHLPMADRASFYSDGKCIRDWKRSRVRVAPALNAELPEGDLM